MTNKPMLSVERKVIEDILADAREPATDYMAARKVLRALLDKEVDGDSHAPESQGEPVAYLHRNTLHTIPALRNNWEPITVASAIAHMQNKALAEEGKEDEWHLGHEFQKCYAEQLAPVAIVMPARLDTEDGYSVNSANWYNKALGDVELLNSLARSKVDLDSGRTVSSDQMKKNLEAKFRGRKP